MGTWTDICDVRLTGCRQRREDNGCTVLTQRPGDREFGRWKVNNLAVERRDFLESPMPLTPEFIRNIRLLGRRPSTQMVTDNLIRKYGTHFLLSATLGGEEALTIFVDKRKLSKKAEVSDYSGNSSAVTLEALHQLAASYFIDRESTLRKLHHIQIASTAIKVTPLFPRRNPRLHGVNGVTEAGDDPPLHLLYASSTPPLIPPLIPPLCLLYASSTPPLRLLYTSSTPPLIPPLHLLYASSTPPLHLLYTSSHSSSTPPLHLLYTSSHSSSTPPLIPPLHLLSFLPTEKEARRRRKEMGLSCSEGRREERGERREERGEGRGERGEKREERGELHLHHGGEKEERGERREERGERREERGERRASPPSRGGERGERREERGERREESFTSITGEIVLLIKEPPPLTTTLALCTSPQHRLQTSARAPRPSATVTETRTGPLGCSNYDNLDSVSSVLVQSPENKVQLQGLQMILPDYLRESFVQAALSYIACNGEGGFVCRDSDCWCSCDPKFPECNCPYMDIQAMEESLQRITETWGILYKEFEESAHLTLLPIPPPSSMSLMFLLQPGRLPSPALDAHGHCTDEFKGFHARLPQSYFLNVSTIQHLWSLDGSFQWRYEQLENSMRVLSRRVQRVIFKLFSLSKRCHKQPQVRLARDRPRSYWLSHFQSLLYCSESNQLGSFSEELHSCSCRYEHSPCQLPPPCTVGEGSACAACAPDNHTRCGSCNPGFGLTQGLCRPMVADSTENYLGFETDLQDLELGYLLQRADRRLEVHAIFISNDMRLNSWFDPSWRKRMLLTLKSNKYKSNMVHMLLGVSLQICLTKNSTLEPVLTLYINPFGGSHSESWYIPVNENNFPDWQAKKLDLPFECYNWTLTLGNKWKTFFETIHIYLRSRIKTHEGLNDSVYYEPLEMTDPAPNLGYMKINSIQVFGYSMHFDPEAIRDLILQLDYPYTQGSQDTAMLQLLEIRDRVNRLSPPGQQRLDLFACLLRHRLKLTPSEVVRIHASLQAFSSRLPNSMDYETTKLCS
ncbi:unnamed protein product [Pleuronectes platessa]|uniref:MACPF domain-containing protein n=1 Tax=Pleuronectes platessa TaxID=8262 RepID=A0A9N7YTV0_PLEPL|nr:unnamed protein product [Pleuronectes platessa]